MINVEWLAANLVCPRDHGSLSVVGESLTCAQGHVYPCIDGVPIMLVEELEPTLGSCSRTLRQARTLEYLDAPLLEGEIDPFVQGGIVGKCGTMYKDLVNRLSRYPIPDFPLPDASGEVLLDVGCGWGRWCISASQKGYTAIGIDPGLDSILAARRVSRQFGLAITYVVADARSLPFKDASIDVAFSYSVLQHFEKADVCTSLAEIRRVLKPAGMSLIQMASAWGVRSIYRRMTRLRKSFISGLIGQSSSAELFEVRYWPPNELKRIFTRYVGPSSLAADGFFGLNMQDSDADLLPRRYRGIVLVSGFLKRLSERAPILKFVADSVYIRSSKP